MSCRSDARGWPWQNRNRARQVALRVDSGLGSDDVLEVRQLTGAGDVPPEVLEIIKTAAPTWSASVWQARG
jgi:hypothetical protein